MSFWKCVLYGYVSISLLALMAIPFSALGWSESDVLSAIPAILIGIPWSLPLLSLSNGGSVYWAFFLVLLAIIMNVVALWIIAR